MDLFSVVRVISFNIYKIYKCFFHFLGLQWGSAGEGGGCDDVKFLD